ncbi:hypothetical protein [Larkinella harenae]
MKKILVSSLIGITVFGMTVLTPSSATTPRAASPQTVLQDTTRNDTNRLRQGDRMRRGQIDDRRPTGDPKQFRSDSLRRGGAVKVDTVRH